MRAVLARGGWRNRRIALALSGGVDSVVLLEVLARLAPETGIALSAMHVNHGISPNALRWERFCRALCARLQVPLTVKRVRKGG